MNLIMNSGMIISTFRLNNLISTFPMVGGRMDHEE